MRPLDRRILALARESLTPMSSFEDATRALQASVERCIPAGRIYLLAATADGPAIGSLISGVGIAADGRGRLHVVRVASGRTAFIEPLVPLDHAVSA